MGAQSLSWLACIQIWIMAMHVRSTLHTGAWRVSKMSHLCGCGLSGGAAGRQRLSVRPASFRRFPGLRQRPRLQRQLLL